MNQVVNFPIDRTRKPAGRAPAILAVIGCEIVDFSARQAARHAPGPGLAGNGAISEASRPRAPSPQSGGPSLARAGHEIHRYVADLKAQQGKYSPGRRSAVDRDSLPIALANHMTAYDAWKAIVAIVARYDSGRTGRDAESAVSELIRLMGASATHRPLPFAWPKVMYAIRGKISMYVATGSGTPDRLIEGVRQLVATEPRGIRA